jgi:peptidoglycan DL-endopeptidase CwlO
VAAPHDDYLRLGSHGREVSEWQEKLNDVTGAGIAVDGDFGRGTHRATVAFQQSERPQADGIVGPLTGAMQRHYQPVEQGPYHPSTSSPTATRKPSSTSTPSTATATPPRSPT